MKTIFGRLRNLLNTFDKTSPRTYEGLLQAEDFFHGPTLDWEPGAEKVVVLAPHMDDEVIGCGGTIARHVDAGADVTVVYLTDGRQGSAALHKLKGEALKQAQKELVATRKEEARRALKCLGVEQVEFLEAEDTQLLMDLGAPWRLRDVLKRIRPKLVYVPFFLEHHPDHRAASAVLLAATKGTDLDFICYGYEVWTPLFPNCMVWIDTTIERKQHAMAEYRSQLDDSNDLMHAMNGLAAYRSVVRSRKQGRFAEAFCVLPLAEYEQAHLAFRHGARILPPAGLSDAVPRANSGKPGGRAVAG